MKHISATGGVENELFPYLDFLDSIPTQITYQAQASDQFLATFKLTINKAICYF